MGSVMVGKLQYLLAVQVVKDTALHILFSKAASKMHLFDVNNYTAVINPITTA